MCFLKTDPAPPLPSPPPPPRSIVLFLLAQFPPPIHLLTSSPLFAPVLLDGEGCCVLSYTCAHLRRQSQQSYKIIELWRTMDSENLDTIGQLSATIANIRVRHMRERVLGLGFSA